MWAQLQQTLKAEFFLVLVSGNKTQVDRLCLLVLLIQLPYHNGTDSLNRNFLLGPPNGPLLTSFQVQTLSTPNHYKLSNQCLQFQVTEQS